VLVANHLLLFVHGSTQIDVASGPVNILASIHPKRCTAIAALPDVAAAQILVVSAPIWLANMPPKSSLFRGLIEGSEDISDTLVPYALKSSSVAGRYPSNKAPSLGAVLCSGPSSASTFLLFDIVAPNPMNSKGTSALNIVKSMLFVTAEILVSWWNLAR
jgi:hypothetical protein